MKVEFTQERFGVKLESEVGFTKDGKILLSSTRNGYQWSTICFDDINRLKQARDSINKAIELIEDRGTKND